MIKSILGGKSKNLFDIDKFVDTNNVKRSGNNLICSVYGTSIGTLGSICPTLKLSDTITVSFKCTSEGASSKFMSMSTTSGGLKIFRSGETFPVSEVGLSAKWYLYSTDYEHRNIPNKTTYSDIQVEISSTATEYVPHELTSYKSIMKVSDVMQVVDKPVSSTGASLVGTSRTMSGITCHYLEDGTGVTLTGTTSTAHATFEFGVYKKPIIGHKYLWFYQHSNASDVINRAYIELKYIDKDGKGHWFSGSEQVYTLSEYAEKFEFHPIVKDNTTCNGIAFYPQLFDLTEMYGAGNEPKTVAEFKAKFPNDYYPYSPSCFVTSYDERMPCKTKNLFSSSTEVGIPSSTKSDSSEKRLLEDGKWYIGFSKNNYYRGPQSDWPGNFQYNIWENSISIYTKLDGYGLAKCIYVEPNTKYTISCKVNGPDINIGCGFYQEDGTFINFFSGKEITTPQNCKFMIIVFSLGIDKNKVTHYVSDIQLVKGTTATDYVPYGYV